MSAETVYYLAGPMTGIAEYNYPAFERAALALRRAGRCVLSPHEVNPLTPEEAANPQPWSVYVRRDLSAIFESECNALVLLPGWPNSKGATLELSIAIALGWPVYFFVEGVFDEGAPVVLPSLLSMQDGDINVLWPTQVTT